MGRNLERMFLLVFGLSSSCSGPLLVSVAPDESEGDARQTHKDEEENRRPNPPELRDSRAVGATAASEMSAGQSVGLRRQDVLDQGWQSGAVGGEWWRDTPPLLMNRCPCSGRQRCCPTCPPHAGATVSRERTCARSVREMSARGQVAGCSPEKRPTRSAQF
jgi:hypothetical protein